MASHRKVWLLLDDDHDLLEIVATLAGLWGKDSIRLNNGRQAIAWVRDVREGVNTEPMPELALLDIRMPDGPQGDEVAREIRRTPSLDKMAIVMMTAYFLDTQQEAYLIQQTGSDGFVRKPFPMLDELRAILERAINNRAAKSAGAPAAAGSPPSDKPSPPKQ